MNAGAEEVADKSPGGVVLKEANVLDDVEDVWSGHTDLEPGCYTKQPNGCPGKKDPVTEWSPDTWGMANACSGASQSACEARKSGHDGWCDNTDSSWLFVAPYWSDSDNNCRDPSIPAPPIYIDKYAGARRSQSSCRVALLL